MSRLIERRNVIVVTLTGPAVVAIAAIGYIGINAIVNWIGDQFKDKDDDKNKQ